MSRPNVPYHLVCWRRCSFRRMPSSRTSRRSSLFDPADLDWRWDTVLRAARQRHRSPSVGGQSLQERHGGALLRGARTSWRAAERRHLTRRWSEPLPGKKITRVKLESRKLKSELALGSGRSSCSRWVAQLNQPRSGSR